MTWLILATISIVTVSIATLLERVLMKGHESDPISYAIVFQFTLGIISLVFALLIGKFVLPDLKVYSFRFIISAFLWAATTVFSFKAIKTLTAGEFTILTTSGSVVTMVLGIFLLKEVFNLRIAIGALLVFISIWITNSNKITFNSRQGVLFALLSAFCSGIAVVNDAFILKNYDAFSYLAIMSLLPGILLSVLFPKKLIETKALLNIKSIKIVSVFCLFSFIQAITYYLAYQRGAPVSQLSPLTKSSVVLTVIMGAIFLNERKDLLRKIIASIVVTLGVILLG